jgi:acyl carrier protein phosphodiesterase
MKILAHMFLSGDSSEKLLAAFLMNTVNYRKILFRYSFPIEELKYHEEIDAYCHQHPLFRKSISRIQMVNEKFKPYIVDHFYDHFLACEWNKYSDVSLEDFQNEKLSLLLNYSNELPPKSRMILMYYHNSDGLKKLVSIRGLHSFSPVQSISETGPAYMKILGEFTEKYSEFRNDFSEFFPDLIGFVSQINNPLPSRRVSN